MSTRLLRYDWPKMGQSHLSLDRPRAGGLVWMLQRFRRCFNKLYDIVRIDHFRGYSAIWEFPASDPNAMNGHWVRTPGLLLFTLLQKEYPDLADRVIAEDLGEITAPVNWLIALFGFAGTRVLQFSFANPIDKRNPHRIVNLRDCALLGTHDNDTIVGWYNDPANESLREIFWQELKTNADESEIHWAAIRGLLMSRADTAITFAGDLLGKGSEARINIPGKTLPENWSWRLRRDELTAPLAQRLADLTVDSGRAQSS